MTKITYSNSVDCPLYGSTNCGIIPKADALKIKHLPTGSGNDYKLSKIQLERIARLSDDVEECDLAEMPALRLTCENGYSWITSIAHGQTKKQIEEYFIGQSFDTEPFPKEVKSKCIKVEFIN